jgi:hypothetical protein
MSSRYERPPRPAGPESAAAGQGREPGAGPQTGLAVSASRRTERVRPAADLSSAAIWESLSRGEDPTGDPEP